MGDSKAEFCRKWREAFRRMQEARRKEREDSPQNGQKVKSGRIRRV